MTFRSFLLNMEISGIKCIEKPLKIDFYGKQVDKNFDTSRNNVKGIYGINGSGKSAIVTAVNIFKKLTLVESYLTNPFTQNLLNELINKKTGEFRWKCEFVLDRAGLKDILCYEVVLAKGNNEFFSISYEKLEIKRNNSKNIPQTVFEIRNGELVTLSNKISEEEKQLVNRKTMNLLSKESFACIIVTLIKEFKAGSFLYDACDVFILAYDLFVYIDEKDDHSNYFYKDNLYKILMEVGSIDSDTTKIIASLIHSSGRDDNAINKDSISSYRKMVKEMEAFIRIFKKNLVCIDIIEKEDGNYIDCSLDFNYGDYKVNEEFESTGIRKLIKLFNCLYQCSLGRIAFVDEMDSNINDVYLCKLIEYFMYYGKGQLCFTAHNLDPMIVLRENKKSIDFLTDDGMIIPWVKNGNMTPDNSYRNGMIEKIPFNIDSTDFLKIFGEV